MTDSQKAAQEIAGIIGEYADIYHSTDWTEKDEAELLERIRQIIDKWLC